MAGIVGLAAALQTACDHLEANAAKVAALRDKLIDGLAAIPHAALNGTGTTACRGTSTSCLRGH